MYVCMYVCIYIYIYICDGDLPVRLTHDVRPDDVRGDVLLCVT